MPTPKLLTKTFLLKLAFGVFALLTLLILVNNFTKFGVSKYYQSQGLTPDVSDLLADNEFVADTDTSEYDFTASLRANRFDVIRPSTIAEHKVGFNLGLLVSNFLEDPDLWQTARDYGIGHILGIVIGPGDLTAAASFVKMAAENEMRPYIRFCVVNGCGFTAGSAGERFALAKQVAQFCKDVYDQSGKTGFTCIIGPNEPATEARFWLPYAFSSGSGNWGELATFIKEVNNEIKRDGDYDKGYAFGIKTMPGIFNLTNAANPEVDLLYNAGMFKDAGGCTRFDYYGGNTYSTDTWKTNKFARAASPYVNGAKGKALASVSKECGIPVVITEFGNAYEALDPCWKPECITQNNGMTRLYDYFSVAQQELTKLLDRTDIHAVMFYRPLVKGQNGITKSFYAGDEIEGGPQVDPRHVFTRKELRSLVNSSKYNEFPICNYEVNYDPASFTKSTVALTQVDRSSNTEKVQLQVGCMRSGRELECEAKGMSTFDVWAPIKDIIGTFGSVSNQHASVCDWASGVLQQAYIRGLVTGDSASASGGYYPVDTRFSAAGKIRVAGYDYSLPGWESARNCSAALASLSDFSPVQLAELSIAAFTGEAKEFKDKVAKNKVVNAEDSPDIYTLGLHVKDTEKTVELNLGSQALNVLNFLGVDPQTQYFYDRGIYSPKEFPQIKTAVNNVENLTPGPEKIIADSKNKLYRKWQAGQACWDNLHPEDPAVAPIRGESLRKYCKWVGGPSNAKCRYSSFSQYAANRFNFGANLHAGFTKSECYDPVGSESEIRSTLMTAEFDVTKISGDIEIPGVKDMLANLKRELERRVKTTIGDSRNLLIRADLEAAVEVNLYTYDLNKHDTKLAGGFSNYSSPTCTIAGGADSYYKREHGLAQGAHTVKYVSYIKDLATISMMLELLSKYTTGLANPDIPLISKPLLSEATETEVTEYLTKSSLNNVNNPVGNLSFPVCDVNDPVLLKKLADNPGSTPYDFCYTMIGWCDQRKDDGVTKRLLETDAGREAYSDKKGYICDASCGEEPTNCGNGLYCPMPGALQPGAGVAGVCPVQGGRCIQGPQTTAGSHGTLNAVDLIGGNLIAPTNGAVVWAAESKSGYTRCTSGVLAGGAVIFKMSNGQHLFFYHINVSNAQALIRSYQQGDTIAPLSQHGVDVDQLTGCFTGTHSHVELASGAPSPGTIDRAEVGKYLNQGGDITSTLAALGCQMQAGTYAGAPNKCQPGSSPTITSGPTLDVPDRCILTGQGGTIGGSCNEWNCGLPGNKSFDASLKCASGISYYHNSMDEWIDRYGPFCDNETLFIKTPKPAGPGLVKADYPFAYNYTKFYDTYLPPGSPAGRKCAEMPPNEIRVADVNMSCPSYGNRSNTEAYNYYRGALKRCGIDQSQSYWTAENTFGFVNDPAGLARYLRDNLNVSYFSWKLKDVPLEKVVAVMQAAKTQNINPFMLLASWGTETWFGQACAK